jgi:hypothetical protein
LYSTDGCCHEHKLLTDVFSTLRDEKVPIGLEKNVPPFTLTQRVEYLRTEGAVRVLAGELQEDVNNGSLCFLGLDTEYPWNQPDKKISTLQLARPGECSARRERAHPPYMILFPGRRANLRDFFARAEADSAGS